MITVLGKGRAAQFSGISPTVDHELYALASNGKMLVSDLSAPFLVKA